MKDTVCGGCSVVCDDVAVEVKQGKLKSLGLCRLGFEYCGSALSKKRLLKPFVRINGTQKSVTIEKALKKVVTILHESRRPLFLGWSTSSNEVIQIGIKLAQQMQGVFDSTASIEYGGLLDCGLVGGEAGQVSLDEIRNLADHVIYWGVNPAESHHRHASRYTVFPKGEKVPEGRESRTVSVIDIRTSESMRLANHQLILKDSKGDEQLLSYIIEELHGKSQALPDHIAGIKTVEFLSFIKHLKDADYLALFYGNGIVHSSNAPKTLSLLKKVNDLLNKNNHRCMILPMVAHSNTIGAVKSCLDATGLPFSIDFTSNSPKPCSSVWKGLIKGEFDAALIVGIDLLSWLPGPTAQTLCKIPIISLSALPTVTTYNANVVIPTAITGAEAGGTVHRMDGTLIQLSPFHKPGARISTEEEILKQLREQLT